jgi:hypothetical protein
MFVDDAIWTQAESDGVDQLERIKTSMSVTEGIQGVLKSFQI